MEAEGGSVTVVVNVVTSTGANNVRCSEASSLKWGSSRIDIDGAEDGRRVAIEAEALSNQKMDTKTTREMLTHNMTKPHEDGDHTDDEEPRWSDGIRSTPSQIKYCSFF